jgi:hypothetical protein
MFHLAKTVYDHCEKRFTAPKGVEKRAGNIDDTLSKPCQNTGINK